MGLLLIRVAYPDRVNRSCGNLYKLNYTSRPFWADCLLGDQISNIYVYDFNDFINMP